MKLPSIFAIIFFAISIISQAAFAANAVTVCEGDSAKFDFLLENTGDPLTYSISASGLSGTLSSTTIDMAANSKTPFYFLAPTQGISPGQYPFAVRATSSRTTANADALLIVQKCYASSLSISPATVSAQQCASATVDAAISNAGTKEDSFTLSASGTHPVSFSQNPVLVPANSQKTIKATIAIPCTATPATVAQAISATGKTTSSASVQVQITAKPTPIPTPSPTPIPTPKPAGCQYNNPPCAQGFECKDNNCYKTVILNNTIVINKTIVVTVTSVPTPTPAPKPAAPVDETPSIMMGSIRVCKNETAKINFDLFNPKNKTAEFQLSSSGVNGTLSATALSVPADSKAAFSFAVDGAILEPKTYLLSIAVKESGAKTQYIGNRIIVEDCFASNLSVTGAHAISTGDAQQVQEQSLAIPSPSSTPAPQPSATPDAPGVSISSEPSLSIEVGVGKELEIEITNNQAQAIENATIFLSGATLSNSKLPAIAAGGKTKISVKISGQKEGTFESKISLVSGKTIAEKNITIFVSKPLLEIQQTQTQSNPVQQGNKTLSNATTTILVKNNAGGTLSAELEVLGAPNATLSNKTISLAKNQSAEITISTLFDENAQPQNATLSIKSNRGTYEVPLELSPKPAFAALTGMFSAAANAWPYGLVLLIATLAYYKFGRNIAPQSAQTESEQGGEAQEQERAASEKKKKSDKKEKG